MTAEWIKNASLKFWLLILTVAVLALCAVVWNRIHNATKPTTISGTVENIDAVTASITVQGTQIRGADPSMLHGISRGQNVRIKALPSKLDDGSLDISLKCAGCGVTKY